MKAVKLGNIGTDHDGYHPTKVIAGSPDVFIDGQPAARVGDPLEPHDKPNSSKHDRAIATGSSTVFINGKPAALTGGAVSCGGVTIGDGTVNIGDDPTSAGTPKLKSIFSRKFIIHDRDGKPIPNCEYKLELDTGEVITGTTTPDGETSLSFSKDTPAEVTVYLKRYYK